MITRGLIVTLEDSKEFESLPPRKWGKVDIPSGSLLSLQLAYERMGTPMIRRGYWIENGVGKLCEIGGKYTRVVEKFVVSPRKENPVPGIWVARLDALDIRKPLSPEDLKAIREGELVNCLVDKYGEFEFKDGDDFFRYGCDKTTIIVDGKEIVATLPDIIGDDREALGIEFRRR